MPDHSNDSTKATEQRLGPFVYDKDDDFNFIDIIERGPYELDNGAIYHG